MVESTKIIKHIIEFIFDLINILYNYMRDMSVLLILMIFLDYFDIQVGFLMNLIIFCLLIYPILKLFEQFRIVRKIE